MSAAASEPGDEEDPFTATVERILSAAEEREEGHLTEKDLKALAELCSSTIAPSSSFLGFADVDASYTGQVVEGLQKLVAAASSIDFVQAGYRALQNDKQSTTAEQVRRCCISMYV